MYLIHKICYFAAKMEESATSLVEEIGTTLTHSSSLFGRKIDVEKVLKNTIYESNRLKETQITKMTLQINGKKQNVAFFDNGNCIITGAQSFEENQKVWETFIHEIERIESLIN